MLLSELIRQTMDTESDSVDPDEEVNVQKVVSPISNLKELKVTQKGDEK